MSARRTRRRTPVQSAVPAPPRARPSLRPWLLLAGLVLATVIAYQPAWHGGLLWDDDHHLTSAGLRGADGLRRIWLEVGATQQYYPVVHSAFWLMDRVWGANVLGYHLVNITLHALSAWLLAVALGRLRIPGAHLAAFLFALHPVHVESVAWMTELKNTLSGVLYLGAAILYLRFDAERGSRPYVAALTVFVLALLAKSVTATLPAALLVVFWWQRGRLEWTRDVRPLLPFFALGLAAGVTTAWVERTFIGAVGQDFSLSVVDRILVAGRAIWFYVGKLLWPGSLSFNYPRWDLDQTAWWQYVFPVMAVVMTIVLWRLRGRTRAPLAAWLFFTGSLFPALGFVNVYPFRYSFVADHFQYLASLGLLVLAAAAITALIQMMKAPARAEVAVIVVAAILLGALTWQQSRQYQSARVLYETTLERNPRSWLAHTNLAALALKEVPPDLDRARMHVDASLALNPANDVAHNNRGVILQRLGDFSGAAIAHREAVRLTPRSVEARTNLGVDLAALGRNDEAIAEYREAIRLDPTAAGPHHNLSVLLLRAGRADEALLEAAEAVRLDPDYAEAQDNMGTALQQQGRFNDAIAAYRAAVRLQPENGAVFSNLGAALVAAGRPDEAVAALQEAARLLPDGRTVDNLGRVLFMQGRLADAEAAFREAVRLAPGHGPGYEHLAAVLQQQGRLPEAIAAYRQALAHMPESAQAHNNLGVVLATLGRLDEAARHFAEAVRLRPDFAEARANLAKAGKGGR